MHQAEEFLPKKTIQTLKKQHYALFGHSAAKLCHYTKTSLKGQGTCYKQKFYGIQSHRCLQMTPSTAFCSQQCTYCWRPFTKTAKSVEKEFDEPGEIVEKALEEQKILLSGFGSLVKQGLVGKKMLSEALEPRHAAISLSGEPTLYPKIAGLAKEFHKRKISTFLVSNALQPEKLKELLEKKAEPTQLYLSIDTGVEEIHKKLNNPLTKDSWERIRESAGLLKRFPRSCIRVTLVKGHNMCNEKELAGLLEESGSDFVELKGYMHVGFSRKRLERKNMPLFGEVKEFAAKVLKEQNTYSFAGEDAVSRVVLLASGKKEQKIGFEGLWKK